MSLGKLEGSGWVMVDPPNYTDEDSVVARYNGEPIKAGFLTERIKDTDSEIHFRYRSGQYDLDVKIDFDIGRGSVKVERAEGYGTA